MDKLIPSYKESIFNDTTKQICMDFVEIGIDSVLDSGVLKSIPFINVVAGAVKIGQNIYDRNLIVQTLAFINGLNVGKISDEKVAQHKKMLDESHQKAEAELGRVIIILNHNIDTQKSKIIGILYRHYVDGIIGWEKFSEMAEITNRLFIQDINLLGQLSLYKQTSFLKDDEYRWGRLEAIGLIKVRMAWAEVKERTLNLSNNSYIELTSCGEQFCDLISSFLKEI